MPQEYAVLDKMIQEYFDSTRDTKRFPTEALMASTFYMWSYNMPLMQYRDKIFKKDTSAGDLKKWASMGPIYKSYGFHIIKKYPSSFVKYFLWPNANKYYAPPVEFLQSYNSGKDSIPTVASSWFGYKDGGLKTRTKSKTVRILDFYPILSGVINLVMLCSLLFYVILKGWQYNTVFNKGISLAAMVWLLNAGFTIFASSAALRFQSFPIILTTMSVGLLIDWMIELIKVMKRNELLALNKEQNALAANSIA